MKSSSESDDEENVGLWEAADTTLLTDDMFEAKPEVQSQSLQLCKEDSLAGTSKSLRYLNDSDFDADNFIPEATQKYVARKLTELMQKRIEFVEFDTGIPYIKTPASRVVLLQGANCYVKPYEELEYDTGPKEKPKIKRRRLASEVEPTEKEKINQAAVCAEYILSGTEVKSWAVKQVRENKFC